MTIEISNRDEEAGGYRTLSVWLCRLVAMALFVLGLSYWTRLVGVFDGALWRFDLMPVSWRLVAPSLAVLYPVAGIGLWMPATWGVVVWLLVIGVEAGMLLAPAIFGGHPGILLFHLAALSFLLLLKLAPRVARWLRHLGKV